MRLSWIRRTRSGGDNWEGEVPLGEAYERYRVTICDGATALRMIDVYTADYRYTEEQSLADFGAGGLASAPEAAFEVAQVSDLVGPGIAGRRLFNN